MSEESELRAEVERLNRENKQWRLENDRLRYDKGLISDTAALYLHQIERLKVAVEKLRQGSDPGTGWQAGLNE